MMLPESSKLNQELLYSLVYPRKVRLRRQLNLKNSYYFLRSKASISFHHDSEHAKFVVNSLPSPGLLRFMLWTT